jgi:glycosyltransferase involved in cell wall biosynthesis
VRFYPDARVNHHVWSFPSLLNAADADGAHADGSPQKFLYIANQFWAHKDHETAFKALALLKQNGIRVDIVCTGREDDSRRPDHVPKLKAMIEDAGLTSQVSFLGLVPRARQIAIFRDAAAVLQPSRFEGWSTVVEDARSLGKRVILSDIDVHREQMPDALFFTAGDPQSLADKIASVWPALKAGPDVAQETAAQNDLAQRSALQAKKLMAIFEWVAQQ